MGRRLRNRDEKRARFSSKDLMVNPTVPRRHILSRCIMTLTSVLRFSFLLTQHLHDKKEELISLPILSAQVQKRHPLAWSAGQPGRFRERRELNWSLRSIHSDSRYLGALGTGGRYWLAVAPMGLGASSGQLSGRDDYKESLAAYGHAVALLTSFGTVCVWRDRQRAAFGVFSISKPRHVR
jgi:hypothetical protein